MDGSWKRRLTPFESLMYEYNLKGKVLIVYQLTINSKNPIDAAIFRRSFQYLQRKTPSLQLTVRKREEEVWFYETLYDLDFEFLPDGDSHAEYEKLLEADYNLENGPMWFAKVIPSNSSGDRDDKNVLESFSNQYQVLLGFCHILTDGSSNMLICGEFMTILDDVISGKDVDDQKYIANQLDGSELHQKYLEVANQIQDMMNKESKTLEQVLRSDNVIPLLPKYYPQNETVNNKTLTIYRSLNLMESQKFFELSKINGVTVNSAISSLFDLAIHRMVKEKGACLTEPFASCHIVNMRRYWDEKIEPRLGLQTGFIFLSYDRKLLEDINDFWLHAKKIHALSSSTLQSDLPLYSIASLCLDTDPAEFEEMFPRIFSVEYLTTNMGNLDSTYFKRNTENIKITDLKRSSSLTYPFVIEHTYHTLNGRLIYSVDYQSSCISTQTMEKFVDYMFNGLQEVLQK